MPRLGLGSSLTGGTVSGVNLSFVTQWTTTGSDEKVTIPFVDDESMNFTIDWGDGSTADTVTAYDDNLGGGAIDHTYAAANTYTVTMTGTITSIKFNNGGDKAKLVKITNWGTFKITIDDAFWGCSNLDITATDAPDLSSLTGYSTGLSHCFHGCTALTSIGKASAWDLSNVTRIAYMFDGCTNFNQDITMWDTSSVTSFQNAIHDATSFNQNISSWDTSAATAGFPAMFDGATSFDQNLNTWDWTEVTDCWDMFNGASAFNNGGVAPNWNMTKTQYFVGMFESTSFNQDLSGCTGIGTATGGQAWFRRMFTGNTSFDQNIGHFVVSNLRTVTAYGLYQMLYQATLSTANYNATLVAWAAQDATDNAVFHGGNSEPTGDGDTARASLISADSWTITDADS